MDTLTIGGITYLLTNEQFGVIRDVLVGVPQFAKGQEVWYMTAGFSPHSFTFESISPTLIHPGNIFDTEAECQAFCDKVKALALGEAE